uniref:Uncharacterized protein n=1 Tax=Arion vulgaris TaxID=1028688 RepID=A0A0B6ZYB3_9EUPU
MDNSLSVIEMNELLAELRTSCSNYYGLSDVLTSVGDSMENLLQKRQNLKAEFLKSVEETLVLCEFEKRPDQWLNMKPAEAELAESNDILTEISVLSGRTDEVQEMVAVASDALDILREKLDVLEEKIGMLEEKYRELDQLPGTSIKTTSDIKCYAMKLSELLNSAQAERDIVMSRVKRMEITLTNFEELASSQSRNVATSKNQLIRMEEKLREFEKFSGIKCHWKDKTSMEIEFLSDKLNLESCDEEYNISSPPDDLRMTLTLIFRENEHNCLELEDIQTNQMIAETESLIQDAKCDKDLLKLIAQLQKIWLLHVSLTKEISQIKCRHAVDWIRETGLLLLIPKNSKSVVCTLKVPSTYPFSGQVVLTSVVGHTSQIDQDSIQPPPNNSLMGWVMHLENLFSLP